MAALILLVGKDGTTLRQTQTLLSDAGYLVAVAPSIAQAEEMLDSIVPDLVVADASFDTSTSLRFVTRSRGEHPDLPVVITRAYPDEVVEARAHEWAVDVVVAPLSNPQFLQRVDEILRGHRRMGVPARRWRRKEVKARVDASANGTPGRVLDVSYGGVRLAFPGGSELPEEFDLRVGDARMRTRAHCAWMRYGPDGELWCGAEVQDPNAPIWREFVDLVWADR